MFLSLVAPEFSSSRAGSVFAKEKTPPIGPDDPTVRLFQLLDSAYGGKLSDYYILADVYKNPNNPNEEFQRVLRLDYDKGKTFGKLNLYVRSVGKMQPEQLKAYTPKMVYEFGVADGEKFVKTEPGSFGRPGDVYLQASEDRPLTSAPVTDETRKMYDRLVTEHVLPSLQKK